MHFLALLFYRIFLFLLCPIILITLLLRSINHKAYRKRLLQRFGILDKSFKTSEIVVHAASVGEVLALKPFIEQLLEQYPTETITVTTFTPTGSEQVTKLFQQRVQHCYLPLDIFFATKLFLNKLQPKLMVFMETELWPNLIAQAQQQSKLVLINARLSNKSMRSYRKLKYLITPAIQRFDQILTQSQINQDNYLAMGALAEKCQLSGNLKFDIAINDNLEQKQQQLAQCLQGKRNTILVASSHPGDEALALTMFAQLKQQSPQSLLIIVPRHPERFSQVVNLAKQAGNQVVTRSSKQTVTANDNVWVIDTLGELLATCALADIVVMGGSFSDIGGHNPLEPALFKKPVIVGPDMSNFQEVFQQLTSEQAIIQIANEQLSDTVLTLLNDDTNCQQLGENAFKVVQANQGATKRSIATVQTLLTKK